MMMADWSDLLAQGKIRELVYGEISVSSYGKVWSDLVQVREYLEVFFGLLVKLLAKLSHMQEERREKVLEDAEHLFDSSIYEDGSNQRLKDITHDLARLEDLDLTIVHLEVLFEGVANVAIQVILFAHLLQLLFALPVRLAIRAHFMLHMVPNVLLLTLVVGLALLVQNELVNAEERDQLR